MAELPKTACVLVCQNRTCRKQGAAKVLAAFAAHAIPEIQIMGSRCLGECGNGPMILVLPEQVWYSRVLPEEVGAIAEQHLQGGKPVAAMLYRKFH
ncbi:MAG: (2Fe-2S) ferredoxin domain-containing protein [Leptolyngbyaceae bacterium]|nr:(2Fe-2S) ferredoxin domain-containing protein [Leptolyngbyaceae bacterium]